MILHLLEEIIWRYRRLIVVFIAIIIVQCFELALLHYKYNIFSKGFLQPFAYLTITDRVIFIVISLWYDLILFGAIGSIWFYVANRLNKYGIVIYYYFTIITVLLMGIWLGLKFKVLSYFNDTINYEIIKNLGGGSLQDALLYASNEIAIFTGIIVICIVAIFFCVKPLSKLNYVRTFPNNNKERILFYNLLIVGIVFTPVITYIVANNNFLRYGLAKKTSYRLLSKSLNTLSDFDFDGYGFLAYPRDFANFNPYVYPGALDKPGNNIDEDGLLGDATVPQIETDSLAEISPQKGKHIILIVLESARADLLEKKIDGFYVAPVMREIAKNGAFIGYAYSHTGYTSTSIKAIFNRDLIYGSRKISLLNFLKSSGYQLSILSGQDESFGNVASQVGMDNDDVFYFDARTAINDRVFVSKEQGSLRLSEERVIEEFKQHINRLDFAKPQFIYLNFQAAHFPYAHPTMQKRLLDDFISRSDIKIENKEWLAKTYWNAIANADWAIGEVIAALKQKNLLHQVTLAILGDHGESLYEDGFLGHGHAINDAQTRIPFIINDPEIVFDSVLGQVDVAELVIRSALGLENRWLDKDKVVFQLVGNLSRPVLIAHVNHLGQRTLLDFRSRQVFFSDTNMWKPLQDALLESEYAARVIRLIKHWETLKWQAHLAKQR